MCVCVYMSVIVCGVWCSSAQNTYAHVLLDAQVMQQPHTHTHTHIHTHSHTHIPGYPNIGCKQCWQIALTPCKLST
jgi:hypothetical protein